MESILKRVIQKANDGQSWDKEEWKFYLVAFEKLPEDEAEQLSECFTKKSVKDPVTEFVQFPKI